MTSSVSLVVAANGHATGDTGLILTFLEVSVLRPNGTARDRLSGQRSRSVVQGVNPCLGLSGKVRPLRRERKVPGCVLSR